MTDTAESYQTTSGLPDDFDCEVTDAWFATDSRYNNGQSTLLFWKATTDDPENPEMDGDIRFGLGSDWESSDGGATVEHPKGKTRFNKNSALGMLLDRAIELGALDHLQNAGPSTQADVWVGTKWHMKRETDEYNIQGEKKTREVLLPNAYMGTGSASGGTVTATDAPAATASILGDLDDSVVAALRAAKSSTPNHAAFVDAAMELTEVTGNTTLVMALATPDGVYAEL